MLQQAKGSQAPSALAPRQHTLALSFLPLLQPLSHTASCCALPSNAPTSTANETFPRAHIVLCTSTPLVPLPSHFVLLFLSCLLLPACKGLIQHVNVLQRHILPAPVLAMGNIKHSGDCCYFIIYEALVISCINNPWLQSVAGTVIEYSWGIFVENFHHRCKPRHKTKNHHNKNFICHFTVSTSGKQNLSLVHPEEFLRQGNEAVGLIWSRFMLHWKEAGTSCIQLCLLSLNVVRMLHLWMFAVCKEQMQISPSPS